MLKIALAFFNLNQNAKELQRAEFRNLLNTIVHSVKEERHGEQIYWFDRDKANFITQGKSQADIIDNLKKYYSNHIFILNDQYILCGPDWVPTIDKPLEVKMVDKNTH